MRVNCLLVRYRDGFTEVKDDTAITADGRIEGFVSYPDYTIDEAQRQAESTLDLLKNPRWQRRVGVVPSGTGDVPFSDFDVADTITTPDQDGNPSEVQVIGMLLTEDDAGNPVYEPEVGDAIPSLEQRQATVNRTGTGSIGSLGGRDPQAMSRGGVSATATKLATPSTGGGTAEHCAQGFRLQAGNVTPAMSGSTTRNLTWTLGTNIATHYTDDVSISLDEEDVEVAAGGLWTVSLLAQVYANSPVSGDCEVTLNFYSEHGSGSASNYPYNLYFEDFAGGWRYRTVALTAEIYAENGGRFWVGIANNLSSNLFIGASWIFGTSPGAPCSITQN